MSAIIQTSALTKVYGRGAKQSAALKNLTLEVKQGEVFGYLGPNGAGKSTTINIMLDLIRPTSGSATLFGMDSVKQPVEIHKRVGFLPAELALWKGDTAKQVIRQIAVLRGDVPRQIKEADLMAEQLGLDLSKKVRDFSTGNKRKLGLVLAMMHRPELLILDEPTSGLDPLVQQTFNHMIQQVKQEGRTVFLSSHVLSEVQAICDRVGILRNGELKSVESVQTLMANGLRKVTLTLPSEHLASAKTTLAAVEGVHDFIVNTTALRFDISGDLQPLLKVLATLPVSDLLITEPSLEEIFLAFYGESGKAN
jgi:ABC-2 type transport system ATP-binding protein